jgi:DNA-binding NarL/FixJ family response regulator
MDQLQPTPHPPPPEGDRSSVDRLSEADDADNPLRIYVIEDSAVIRENLIATLEEMLPVEVVGAADNEGAATSWLQDDANRSDLVIVDIFLKGGSGLGVLRSLADTHTRRKVVVLSNYATPDMRRRCLELGADRVFDKSSDIDMLLSYCDELASGTR